MWGPHLGSLGINKCNVNATYNHVVIHFAYPTLIAVLLEKQGV